MKKTNALTCLSILAFTFLFVSCKKEAAPAKLPRNNSADKSLGILSTTDVYVSGTWRNLGVGTQYGRVWLNSNPPSSLGAGTSDANTSAIRLSGTDVYVVGREGNQPKYWKNGVSVNLPLASGANSTWANNIFINGTDIYVVGVANFPLSTGFYQDRTCYWKNGVLTVVGGTSYATGGDVIAVSGSDIYIGGRRRLSSGYDVACYWKNGTEFGLSSDIARGAVTALLLLGTDVYMAAAGANNTTGVSSYFVWKNGTLTSLSGGANVAFANANLAASGTDVYVSFAGRETSSSTPFDTKIFVWKNGTLYQTITKASGSAGLDGTINALAVSGTGDVYIAGRDNFLACYWKNGTRFLLSTGSYAYSTGLAIREY